MPLCPSRSYRVPVGASVIALFASVFGMSSSAAAQEAQDVAAARALGQKGTLAAQTGRCDEAVDLLTRAKALMPVPTVLTPLGECQVKLGKLVDGSESLQAAVRADIDASSPKAYVKAQAHAKELLAAVLPRLAHLTIDVKVPSGVSAKATDNGVAVSSVLFGIDRPVDPGKHTIEANAKGYLPKKASITLSEGQKERVPLELAIDPHPPAEAVPADGHPGVTDETGHPKPAGSGPGTESHGSGQLIAGIVTTSAGGAMVGIGAILGGLALSKKSTLDDACDAAKHCPATSASDVSSMKTFANTSTALFVIGLSAAAAGTVVILTSPHDAPKRDAITLTPLLGPGSIGLAGRF